MAAAAARWSARCFVDDGLVDQVHLFVYPVALGAGEKPFADGTQTKFALARSETYENGVVHLDYWPL